MQDIIVVGGGVVGLTAALELSKRGFSVSVIDKAAIGQEASWAGAGMLPPGQISGPQAIRQLARLSASLWPALSEELLQSTGIDNGYRNSGALQVSLTDESQLPELCERWQAESVEAELLDSTDLHQFSPLASESLRCGVLLPTMCQVRNPRHLKTLASACRSRGVEILQESPVTEIVISDHRVERVIAGTTEICGGKFLITSGAWTSPLLERVGCRFEIEPVRGQIVLMKSESALFSHLLEDGPRYLVPRDDGHLLIGSTEEEVGFVKQTTSEAVEELTRFACSLVPKLKDVSVVRAWSGFRPRAKRGVPAIGRVDQFENLFVAAGHFRDGLSQSPATAHIIGDIIENRPSNIELDAFAIRVN